MAQIEAYHNYSLINLSSIDLRVLDLALSYYKDEIRHRDKVDGPEYDSLQNLHDLVLEAKSGS